MSITSKLLSHFPAGIVLDVVADDLPVRAYVAISAPDIEAVTAFVPPEQFSNDANLHVAAVGSPAEAAELVEDILFNMEAGDAVAFLCADQPSWLATVQQLGHNDTSTPLE